MLDEYNSKEYQSTLENIVLKRLGCLEIRSDFQIDNFDKGDIDVDIKNECVYQPTNAPNIYRGIDKYVITGKISTKDVLSIQITMYLIFETGKALDEDFLTTFQETTHKLITYPYLRETVQYLTAKMGLTPLTLPLWRPLIKQKQEA